MRNKPEHELAIKKSVSMPAILFGQGYDRMREHGLYQFSDYVQHLIRMDVQQPRSKGGHPNGRS